ncbi:MAG: FimV/HubP family polar landmark protein [Candidatus Sedimenticola sp. (ex Thyasira tokunagai)]
MNRHPHHNMAIPLLIGIVPLVMPGCTTEPTMLVNPKYAVSGGETAAVTNDNYQSGLGYFRKGTFGLALVQFQAELSKHPDSVRALNGIGACYDQLGRYNLAMRYYHKALQIDPISSKTLHNLGHSLALQKRYAEAEKIEKIAQQSKSKPVIPGPADERPGITETDTALVVTERIETTVIEQQSEPEIVTVQESIEPQPIIEAEITQIDTAWADSAVAEPQSEPEVVTVEASVEPTTILEADITPIYTAWADSAVTEPQSEPEVVTVEASVGPPAFVEVDITPIDTAWADGAVAEPQSEPEVVTVEASVEPPSFVEVDITPIDTAWADGAVAEPQSEPEVVTTEVAIEPPTFIEAETVPIDTGWAETVETTSQSNPAFIERDGVVLLQPLEQSVYQPLGEPDDTDIANTYDQISEILATTNSPENHLKTQVTPDLHPLVERNGVVLLQPLDPPANQSLVEPSDTDIIGTYEQISEILATTNTSENRLETHATPDIDPSKVTTKVELEPAKLVETEQQIVEDNPPIEALQPSVLPTENVTMESTTANTVKGDSDSPVAETLLAERAPDPAASPETIASAPTENSAMSTPLGVEEADSLIPETAATDFLYGPVKSGEKLWHIAAMLAEKRSVSTKDMLLALIRSNPEAFYRNNPNRLKIGYTLWVPDHSEVSSQQLLAAKDSGSRGPTATLEVANGNGRKGMAKTFRHYLSLHGMEVSNVSDAASFTLRNSIVYFKPGFRAAAEQLATMVPMRVEMKPYGNIQGSSDVKLIVGHDVFNYEGDLRRMLLRRNQGSQYEKYL